jgi:transposase
MVGFFAVLIANETDEINRFPNEKKLFSYFRTIPSTCSSGSRTFHGRLTKQGNRYLRWASMEAHLAKTKAKTQVTTGIVF